MNGILAIVCGLGIFSGVAPTIATPGAESVSLRAMRSWTLVTAKDAIPSEKYAAKEFRRLFKLATGVEAPTPSLTPGDHGNIFIGVGQAMRAQPLGFDIAGLGDEGVRIRIARDTLIIAGGRPRGTLYAVYEFFERYLGVRFLTRDDTYVPKDAGDTAIPFVDYTYIPPFSFRWSYYGETNSDEAFAARLRNNTVTPDEKYGGNTPHKLISHSVESLCPVSKYGKNHPEYFAMVNGVRKLSDGGGGPQLCVTNPAVIKIVADAVDKELDANPSLKNVSVSQMDNGDYCQCPRCQAITEREGSPMGPQLAFVNAVAERVAKKHPGVMIGTLAYAYSRKPPKTIHARDNVEIQLCSIECCTLHPIDDPSCEVNREFCADLKGWKSKCKHIWIWNYNTNFRGYDLPFPNLGVISKNIQFFLDNGAQGVFMQAAGNGMSAEMSDLRNYVISRCLWHPSEQSWSLVEEFCHLHYRESAGPIIAYEKFLQHNAEIRGLHPGCFPTAGEVGLDANVAKRIQEYFDKALRLAKSDTVRARVEKASIPAFRARIATAPMRYADGVFRLDESAIGKGTIDKYAALCKKYNMTRVAEDTPVSVYLHELDSLRKGMPAAVIENRVWRVVLLPEQNGKIVEMTYKPTGRNLVEARGRGFDRWRSHEEWIDGQDSANVVYTCEKSPRTITLTRKLPNGTVIRRTVSLASDGAKRISFRTEITNGPTPATHESHIHPEYDTVLNSNDPKVIAIYVKNPGWVYANKDWRWDASKNPDQYTPKVSGGAFAYYNHAEHFGVIQTFNPADFTRTNIYWSPGRRQLNLEMLTPVTSLGPGQKFSYGYEVGYLDKAPI